MTEPADTLGVGIVGLGIGAQHAEMYGRLAVCELRWLYDLDPDAARAVRDRLGAGTVADSYDAVLADSETDVVSIASFDHHHAGQVRDALAAGKQVFVEKPLCRGMDELGTVAAAWAEAGRPHLRANLVLRGAPLYRWLREAIADGRLGRVYAFDGDYLYGRLHKITDGWRAGVPDYSVMEGGGVHMIDLMLWLTGERPETVAAVGNHLSTPEGAGGFDDFAAATFTFPSGLVGRITANFGCVHRHHHVVRVFGTEATFIYDDAGPRLHTSRDEDGRAEPIDLAPLPDHKGVLIPDFVDAILRGRESAAAAQREFDLVSACSAADQAKAQGTAVTVEYL